MCGLLVGCVGLFPNGQGKGETLQGRDLWWASIALDFVKRVAARDSAFANDYQLINFIFFWLPW